MDYCSNYNEFWITGNGYDNEYMERDRGEADIQSKMGRHNGKEKESERKLRAYALCVYAYVEIAYELLAPLFDLSLARHRADDIQLICGHY